MARPLPFFPSVVTPLLLASGCTGSAFHARPVDTAEQDTALTLLITALEPDSGPATGGTSVRITGGGFTPATTATVGGAACASLTYLSAAELLCVTPPGAPGATTVEATETGATTTAAFTYLDSGGGDSGDSGGGDSGGGDSGDSGGGSTTPVDYCHLQYPCATTTAAGARSEAVYAWVYQAGVTPGAGAGAGLRVEIGVGDAAADPTTWSWSPMTYNTDKDGLTPGDLSNDEYAGGFTAPAAPGTYAFLARASADAGRSWLLCDAGGVTCGGRGSDDGYAPADAGTCTVP